MNKLEKLKKLLEGNYNFRGNNYEYFPKTHDELIQLVDDLIKQYGNNVDLNIIDVSDINDFSYLFAHKSDFNGNVSLWDVSNGKNFNSMFDTCYKFNGDLSKWDVSDGEYFDSMFFQCYKFNSDLSQWDVSRGKYFQYMFYGCKSFDADLSKWDVSNAKYWTDFAIYSLLEEFPERIPARFRGDYL